MNEWCSGWETVAGECINLELNVLNDFSENGWCSVNGKNIIHLSRDLSCRLFFTSHRQPGTISSILPAISPNKLSKSICQWKRKSLDFHQTNLFEPPWPQCTSSFLWHTVPAKTKSTQGIHILIRHILIKFHFSSCLKENKKLKRSLKQ